MASNRSPPAFPVPSVAPAAVDDVTNRFQRMHFSPPTVPPPGYPGGFRPNMDLETLSRYGDPYRSQGSFQSYNKPLPSTPPPVNIASKPKPQGRLSSPLERPPSSPFMPVPNHYQASSSAPELPPATTTKPKRRSSDPAGKAPRKSSPSDTPRKSASRRQSSSSEDSDAQCHGVTTKGIRCKRKVQKGAPPAALYMDPMETVERFCHDHQKQILTPTVIYSKKKGAAAIPFDAWIPPELSDATKVALRSEMEKPVSDADSDGYIYCFEILDPNNPGFVHFKVGRSNNIHKRFDQWEKQCSSKEQVPRGRWPEAPDGSLLKGKIGMGPMGPNVHRLEKLIHLELGDLAANAQYLDPHWHSKANAPSASTSIAAASTSAKKGKGKVVDARMSGKVCADCGKIHKEIFTLTRMSGEYENMEWDNVVKPTIEKWGAYVEQYL